MIDMVRKYKIFLIIVMSLFISSFTKITAVGSTPYYLRVSSIEADSVVLKLYNSTSEPAYLFDGYFSDVDSVISSYLHLYDTNDKVAKISYLPFQQYTILPLLPNNQMLISGADFSYRKAKEIYLKNKNHAYYHFTKIESGDSLTVKISKDLLKSDCFFQDVDLKEYTFLDITKDDDKERVKKELKLKRLKKIPTFDEVTVELAVYKNIDIFSEYEVFKTLNYKYIRLMFSLCDLDKAASDYQIVSCTLNLRDTITE